MEQYEQALRLWQSYHIETAADLDARLDSFRVRFAYNSGKIENEAVTYQDTREIFENGKVTGYTGDPRALFEQQNQKLCYEYLKEKIIAREPVSPDLILEIHRILTSGTYDERRYLVNNERPGEFKKHDYVTGIHEVGSAAADVERDLTELLDEVNGNTGGDTLRVGTYLHVRFEDIHPFADGNGRVGRTLLNYHLMTRGHPPLIVYDEHKNLYYEALRAYDESETIDPLHKFFIHQTERTWENALRLEQGMKRERKGIDMIPEP